MDWLEIETGNHGFFHDHIAVCGNVSIKPIHHMIRGDPSMPFVSENRGMCLASMPLLKGGRRLASWSSC